MTGVANTAPNPWLNCSACAKPPTAVYAHSDEVALGAFRTLRRAGLRVPEDISVIGIDDHPLAELTDLTTVRQPVHQQGARAAEIVLGLLQGHAYRPRGLHADPSWSSAGAPPRRRDRSHSSNSVGVRVARCRAVLARDSQTGKNALWP